MNDKFEIFKITLNVLVVNCVIGLAISYFSQLFTIIPDINFLEACGVYCIFTPINHMLSTMFSDKENKL